MNIPIETPYPTVKVILGYVLLSGLVGEIAFLPIYLILFSDKNVMQFLQGLVFIYGEVWIVSLIPALLTSIFLVQRRITKANGKRYLFRVGMLVTMVLGLIVMGIIIVFILINNPTKFNHWLNIVGYILSVIVIVGIMALIGGVSSLIIGQLVLPEGEI